MGAGNAAMEAAAPRSCVSDGKPSRGSVVGRSAERRGCLSGAGLNRLGSVGEEEAESAA
jgi:hypothetical protein